MFSGNAGSQDREGSSWKVSSPSVRWGIKGGPEEAGLSEHVGAPQIPLPRQASEQVTPCLRGATGSMTSREAAASRGHPGFKQTRLCLWRGVSCSQWLLQLRSCLLTPPQGLGITASPPGWLPSCPSRKVVPVPSISPRQNKTPSGETPTSPGPAGRTVLGGHTEDDKGAHGVSGVLPSASCTAQPKMQCRGSWKEQLFLLSTPCLSICPQTARLPTVPPEEKLVAFCKT